MSLYFQYTNIVLYYFAACVILKLPTGSLHFRGSGARAADGVVTRVRVFSSTSSAKGPLSGLCEPEGSQPQVQILYSFLYVMQHTGSVSELYLNMQQLQVTPVV
jgi:hypothetical protein